MHMKLGFIGSGNMGQALMRAIATDASFEILACDTLKDNLDKIKDIAKALDSNVELAKKSDIVFLCVKPQDISAVLDEINAFAQDKLIVSIAAGISLHLLEQRSPKSKFIRVMPNLPCLVGEMAAGYAAGKNCTSTDKKLVHELLNKAGVAFELEESQLDTVTGLSGSGPAFVAYLIEGFTQAGIEQGLSKEVASQLSLQTFLGTARLLKEKNLDASELIAMVSSPHGTTVAGREVLENSDIKEVIKKSVQKAAQRSKELGQ